MSMPIRSLTTAALVSTLSASWAVAEVNPDAKATLENSAAAIGQVESIAYHARQYGTGMLSILDFSGDVELIRSEEADTNYLAYVHGRYRNPGEPEDTFFTVSTDGQYVTWVDEETKTVYEKSLRDRRATSQQAKLIGYLIPDPFQSDTPYQRELELTTITSEGLDEVNGEVCEKIVAYNEPNRQFIWYIAVTDQLPRKLEEVMSAGEQGISRITELTKVDPNSDLSPNDLAVETPEGYVRQSARMPEQPAQSNIKLGLPAGTDAPSLSCDTPDGETVSLADFAGQPVLLNFWSPVFVKSVQANDMLAQLTDAFKTHNIKVLNLTCRTGQETIRPIPSMTSDVFTTLIGADDAMAPYRVLGFPSYYLIDSNGKVAAFFQSYPGNQAILDAINKLNS